MNQLEASRLASEAFKLWGEGRPDLSVPLYREALAMAEPTHHMTPLYHGQLAAVLSDQGLLDEAEAHYQLAISLELEQGASEFSTAVAVARYFLAQHFLQREDPAAALEAVEPSAKDDVSVEWLLRYVRTLALHALGEQEKARHEADLTLRCTPSEAKRQELADIFNQNLGYEMRWGDDGINALTD